MNNIDYEKTYLNNNFNKLEKTLNLKFDDHKLLVLAFTHSSYFASKNFCYQRLEFLGDSILGVIISDFIYRNHSEMSEGEMSKLRAILIAEAALIYLMKTTKLDEYILVGNSILKDNTTIPPAIIADVFESLVAAIYLDCGYDAAEKFVTNNLINHKDTILQLEHASDYKTKLQEYLQKNGNVNLQYNSVESANGFTSTVMIDDIILGTGCGQTKKKAEQAAAKMALEKCTDY